MIPINEQVVMAKGSDDPAVTVADELPVVASHCPQDRGNGVFFRVGPALAERDSANTQGIVSGLARTVAEGNSVCASIRHSAISFFGGVVFTVSLSLFSGCSQEDSGAFSGKGLPSRRAVRGEKVPLIIVSREDPLHVEAIPGLAQCVTDEELFIVVSSALPMWHPPTVPSLLHELRFWGVDSQFTEEMVGQERSGVMMRDTLLSNAFAKENVTIATKPSYTSHLMVVRDLTVAHLIDPLGCDHGLTACFFGE